MSFRRRPLHSWIGVATIAPVALALATLGAASPSVADPRQPVPAHAHAAFAWSPEQVRELIAAIEEARRDHGLDPQRYGAAALRAELDLCEQLWNTPGSRQLDALARAAALALASDYRRQALGRPAPVAPAELEAALVTGRIRPWLAAQAPRAQGRNS